MATSVLDKNPSFGVGAELAVDADKREASGHFDVHARYEIGQVDTLAFLISYSLTSAHAAGCDVAPNALFICAANESTLSVAPIDVEIDHLPSREKLACSCSASPQAHCPSNFSDAATSAATIYVWSLRERDH